MNTGAKLLNVMRCFSVLKCTRLITHNQLLAPLAVLYLRELNGGKVSVGTVVQELRYTLNDSNILTPEERLFYEENGYIVVKKLIPEEDIDNYTRRFEQLCTKETTVPGMLVMRDVVKAKAKAKFDEMSVNKLQNFQNDPTLFTYCQHPKILKYAEAFVGKDIMAVHNMLINKPPDPGSKTSRHPLHQDLHYFSFRPADRIVTSWTAMEDIHRDNGCLVVVPGSHKGKLLEHGYPDWEGGVNGGYYGAKGYDENTPRVHLIMEPGDTVFFHPLLIHGSGVNRTNGFRKAISCHFASSHCRYGDVSGTTQQLVLDDFKDMHKRKKGADYQYFDKFKERVRLVQGQRVNL